MVALVLLSAAASTAFAGTCLNAADLWRTLKGDTRYLSTGDRRLVKSSLEVLLAKVSVAERAERAQPHTLTPGVVIDDVLPRSPPAEALLVLSAVRTAKDLLKLRCDAATVTARFALTGADRARADACFSVAADIHGRGLDFTQSTALHACAGRGGVGFGRRAGVMLCEES